MTDYDKEGIPRIIRLSWEEPPIRAHRVLAFGLDGSNAVAIKVASDGTVATSGGGGGGGGTQYAEPAALGTTPTGTLAMARSSADTAKPLKLNASQALLVDGSAVTQPVSAASLPTHGVTIASGGVASGAIASGAIAAGAASIAADQDDASLGLDRGVKVLATRKLTPANTSGTDGDYEFLQMSGGRLWASVVVDTALPSGTNAIGKLAANSGVDIGDVDVTSTPEVTAAYNAGQVNGSAMSGSGGSWLTLASAPTNPYRMLTICNQTDATIDYSFDASAIHGILIAGQTIDLYYKANQLSEARAISVRGHDATGPARGKVSSNGVTA